VYLILDHVGAPIRRLSTLLTVREYYRQYPAAVPYGYRQLDDPPGRRRHLHLEHRLPAEAHCHE
jgi:hypothetical protein